MLGLSLFLPALLGGFVFVSRFYVTRLWIKHRDGYPLILGASVAGGLLWFLSHVGWVFLGKYGCCKPFLNLWDELVPVEYSLGAATAFALGMILPPVLNLGAKIPCLSIERFHKQSIIAELIRSKC